MNTTSAASPGKSIAQPVHAWIVPGSVAISGRPGGGGRGFRVARRESDLNYYAEQGVTTIVSAMRSRASLVEYSQSGFGVRWHPLVDIFQGRVEIARLAEDVAETMAREPGAILVHTDRVSEWTAAISAAIRFRLGIAENMEQALEQAEADGFPVGGIARALCCCEEVKA